MKAQRTVFSVFLILSIKLYNVKSRTSYSMFFLSLFFFPSMLFSSSSSFCHARSRVVICVYFWFWMLLHSVWWHAKEMNSLNVYISISPKTEQHMQSCVRKCIRRRRSNQTATDRSNGDGGRGDENELKMKYTVCMSEMCERCKNCTSDTTTNAHQYLSTRTIYCNKTTISSCRRL